MVLMSYCQRICHATCKSRRRKYTPWHALDPFKNPVPFGVEELDPIEFVCCLSAIDHKSYLKAFFSLVNMLRDAEYRQMLHEAECPEEMAGIIEKYEHSNS